MLVHVMDVGRTKLGINWALESQWTKRDSRPAVHNKHWTGVHAQKQCQLAPITL